MKEKPMLESDLETLVLDHARRGLRPSAVQRQLTLQRLDAALGVLPAATFADLSAQAPPVPQTAATTTAATVASAGRFSWHALVAGVLTGAAVGFGTGVMIGSGEATSAPTSAAPLERGPSEPRDGPDTEPHEVAARPERKSEPSTAPVPQKAARKPPGVAGPPASASSEAAEATFYEELSYVRRAQSALQQSNGILALGLMQSLDEIRPRGALMAERSMTRVLALCQLDRVAEATVIARGMLQGDGTADVYRQRLAGSCAGAALLEAHPQSQSVKDRVGGNTKPPNFRTDSQEQESNP